MSSDPDVDHRVAGQDAGGEGLLDAGVDGGDVLLGDHPAGDLVHELVAAAGPGGLEGDDHVAVLAPAAGLADVAALDLLDRLADGLAVGHLGLAHVGVHDELAQHPVDEHLEVELAHARDDRLAGLLVGADPEGRVLLGQGEQGLAQLVLVGLGLGLDGHVDDRLGELERLEQDRVVRVAQGVAGGGLLEAHRGHDVAGEDGVVVLAVVGVHLQDAADPLLAASLVELTTVDALGQGARVDPQVGELADVGVGHDLEGQGGEGLGVVGLALDGLALGGRSRWPGGRRGGSAGSRPPRRAWAGRPCS